MAILRHARRGRAARHAARSFVTAALAVALVLCPVPATAQAPIENEVKAVFLFNFAKYVDWPSVPQGSSSSIRICVPANPTFLTVVREAVKDEIVNGRPLTATGLEGLDDARRCDILYVGNAATRDAAAWIGAVRGRQTLTVGDGRLAEGLVIAFVRDQDRLRFDINRHAATRQGLSISSRLLDLARTVTP